MSKRTLDVADASAVGRRIDPSVIDPSVAAHQCSTWAKAKAAVDEWGLDADVFQNLYDMCYRGSCSCHDQNIAHASREEPSKQYAFLIA